MSVKSDPHIVLQTDIQGYPLLRRGKVRDIYFIDDTRILIVATDRLSAFDVVLPNGIPHKGPVLTQLSRFWFERLRTVVENHLITTDVEEFDEPLKVHRDILSNRSMLVRRADVIPIECVVRGYLSGSAWKEYKESLSVGGIPIPNGLVESAKLPDPIFTPSTKSEQGHDLNITEAEMANRVGVELTKELKELSLTIYTHAAAYALERGIIIADTKFEFGLWNGRVIWIDEALTPDSSRFWAADHYRPGGPQPSYDKQYVRDYLESIGWDKTPPAPPLPPEVVRQTSEKYLLAYKSLTGADLIL